MAIVWLERDSRAGPPGRGNCPRRGTEGTWNPCNRRSPSHPGGATGYLLKDSDSAQIISAIRSIYKGESLIHPSVASKILAEFSLLAEGKGKRQARTEHDLTDREITVLRLVADGKTNKEIANELDLSEKTVKNHVRNIFHKLQVYDRTQAAILAIRKGLIELDPKP